MLMHHTPIKLLECVCDSEIVCASERECMGERVCEQERERECPSSRLGRECVSEKECV